MKAVIFSSLLWPILTLFVFIGQESMSAEIGVICISNFLSQ